MWDKLVSRKKTEEKRKPKKEAEKDPPENEKIYRQICRRAVEMYIRSQKGELQGREDYNRVQMN